MLQTSDLFPLQQETVDRVASAMDYRVIIADEVGLGKTIEVGALLARKAVAKADTNLLLVLPKALLTQWRGELLHKFCLAFELDEELILNSIPRRTGLRVMVSHGLDCKLGSLMGS